MRPTDPRLRAQLAPGRRPLLGVLAAGVAASGLVIAQAWVVTGLVVAVVQHRPLGTWLALVVAVFAARGLVGATSDVLAARAAAAVGSALRRRIVRAALSSGHTSGDAAPATGKVAVLATRGVAAAEPYLTRYLPAFALAGVLPLLTVVAIATQDLLSALIVVLTLPLVPVFGALVGLATRDRAERQWRAMASLSGHFLDVVRGLPTLVVHRRTRAQVAVVREVTDRYRRASLDTLRLAFASSAVLELVATLSVALVAVVVGVRLAAGHLDLRTALVVLLLAPEAYWPLRKVGAEFHAAAEGVATFEAVDALTGAVDAPQPAVDQGAPADGDLVVRGLGVVHPGRVLPALEDVDLTVPARGVTVVVGPSGCGKSTLLAAIADLVPRTAGTVTVGGVTAHGPAWQRRVAWLPQRPVFLTGTVADNLRLGAPDATDDELWDVLRRVAMEERVRDLPAALATAMQQDGTGFSAGERARLALARTVLADRPVVLLDEPTAHLDALTEQVIADTIAELGRTSAVVVVAHRAALVDLADRVVRLAPPRSRPVPATAPGPVAERVDPPASTESRRRTPSYRRGLVGATLLASLASASGVALTATAGWLIVQASTRPAVLTLLLAVVGVRAFGLARPVLRYAERLRSHDVALRMLTERRVQVFAALVPLTPARLGRRRGDLLSSVVDDVDSVVDRELRVRMPVRSFVLVGALAAGVAWWLAPAAGAVVLAAAVLGPGLAVPLAALGARRAERASVATRARLSAQVVEAVQAREELVMWQAADRAAARISATSEALGRATTAAARWSAGARLAAVLVGGGSVALTAAVVAPLVATGALSAPVAALLVLVPLALAELTVPLADAGSLHARTRAAADRLVAIERTEPAVREHAARPVPGLGTVEVASVDAGWVPRQLALHDLSLEVRPGERIAVVGESGTGKSTLAALLMRFIDPSRGVVSVDGVPVHHLALDDLRGLVGLVDDDPHVFATTLAENVRLARPGANDDEVAAALRQACLGPWLDALPDGLGTWLGDGHGGVSGGERARLAVARSLLAGHRVLVLDEPTAHLDHATATEVAHEVLRATDGRTVVWIGHDPLGPGLVDRVVDLGQARLRASAGPVPR